jgi:hypothetical protein
MPNFTPKFRLSFPYLAEQSKKRETGELDGYSCQAIIKKSDITPEFQKSFREMIKQALIKKFGDQVPDKIKSQMKNNPVYPLRDGDDKGEFETWRDEYAGSYIGTLKAGKYQPGCLVRRLGDKALSKEEILNEFYAGCYCIATITAYAWEKMGKRGVSIGLQNILKVSDGEPLGIAKASAASDFEDLLDEEPEIDTEYSEEDSDDDW